MSSKSEERVKDLMSVLVTSMPVTRIRVKAVEKAEIDKTAKAIETAKTIKTAGAGKNGKWSEGEYLENLVQLPYIRYPITFRKKSVPVLVLFDLGSEVNTIYPTFFQELGLPIKPIDMRAQKIDDTTLDIFAIVVTAFLGTDKANLIRFFEETFPLANVHLEVVFEISFLTLSSVVVNFLGRKLQ